MELGTNRFDCHSCDSTRTFSPDRNEGQIVVVTSSTNFNPECVVLIRTARPALKHVIQKWVLLISKICVETYGNWITREQRWIIHRHCYPETTRQDKVMEVTGSESGDIRQKDKYIEQGVHYPHLSMNCTRWKCSRPCLLYVIFNTPNFCRPSACPGTASDRNDATLRSNATLLFPQYWPPAHKSVIAINVGLVEHRLLYMHCTWNQNRVELIARRHQYVSIFDVFDDFWLKEYIAKKRNIKTKRTYQIARAAA